jgi:enoyl-CoA hydratase/carnithine racemase
MSPELVSFSKKSHIANIVLNKPVINQEMAQDLVEACQKIHEDDDICVVTITGSGDAFCRGDEGDIAEAYHPATAIAAIEQPVIVAINGDALGLGLELALSCDIRIASAEARFAMPQVAAGLVPTDGGTQRLPRIIGRGKALELLLTGITITAAEALEIGLISKIFSPNDLTSEAAKLAEVVATKGPIALRYLKEAVLKGIDMTLEQGLKLEADLYFLLHTTSDRTEGIKSFLEKHQPKYKGK